MKCATTQMFLRAIVNRIMIAGLTLIFFNPGSLSQAMTFDDILLEGWYGTGSNKAVLVVDFWPGNGMTDSFAFGALFDTPTITGLDLLEIVKEGTASDFDFYAPWSTSFNANEVKMMAYTDRVGTIHFAEYEWPNFWFSYWFSDDAGESWGPPIDDEENYLSVDQRILQNGDVDGWLVKPGSDWTSQPITPIPEPSSIVAILIGSLAWLACASRRRL